MTFSRHPASNFSRQPSLMLSQGSNMLTSFNQNSRNVVGEASNPEANSIYAEPHPLFECCGQHSCKKKKIERRPALNNNVNGSGGRDSGADVKKMDSSENAIPVEKKKKKTDYWGLFKTGFTYMGLLISCSLGMNMAYYASGLNNLIFGDRPFCMLVDSQYVTIPSLQDINATLQQPIDNAKPQALMSALTLKPPSQTPPPAGKNFSYTLPACLERFEDAGLTYSLLKTSLDNALKAPPTTDLLSLFPEFERSPADESILDECARRFAEVGSSYYLIKQGLQIQNRTHSSTGRQSNTSVTLGQVWDHLQADEIDPDHDYIAMAANSTTANCEFSGAGGSNSSSTKGDGEDAEDEEVPAESGGQSGEVPAEQRADAESEGQGEDQGEQQQQQQQQQANDTAKPAAKPAAKPGPATKRPTEFYLFKILPDKGTIAIGRVSTTTAAPEDPESKEEKETNIAEKKTDKELGDSNDGKEEKDEEETDSTPETEEGGSGEKEEVEVEKKPEEKDPEKEAVTTVTPSAGDDDEPATTTKRPKREHDRGEDGEPPQPETSTTTPKPKARPTTTVTTTTTTGSSTTSEVTTTAADSTSTTATMEAAVTSTTEQVGKTRLKKRKSFHREFINAVDRSRSVDPTPGAAKRLCRSKYFANSRGRGRQGQRRRKNGERDIIYWPPLFLYSAVFRA